MLYIAAGVTPVFAMACACTVSAHTGMMDIRHGGGTLGLDGKEDELKTGKVVNFGKLTWEWRGGWDHTMTKGRWNDDDPR